MVKKSKIARILLPCIPVAVGLLILIVSPSEMEIARGLNIAGSRLRILSGYLIYMTGFACLFYAQSSVEISSRSIILGILTSFLCWFIVEPSLAGFVAGAAQNYYYPVLHRKYFPQLSGLMFSYFSFFILLFCRRRILNRKKSSSQPD